MGYRIINGQAYSVGNFESLNNTKYSSIKFEDVLNKLKIDDKGFVLSKHAVERLNDINFAKEDMNAIKKGFDLAEEKGAKKSVMIYKDVALIASIENRTLITAVEKDRAESNVFTNIDSVVIL
ncbi:MAG: flagellar biosynthesis protein [Clostridium sp.]|nr:flagellar biosynthesis protein [Clostridium sp.]